MYVRFLSSQSIASWRLPVALVARVARSESKPMSSSCSRSDDMAAVGRMVCMLVCTTSGSGGGYSVVTAVKTSVVMFCICICFFFFFLFWTAF